MDHYSPPSSMDDSAPPLDSESDSDTFQSFIDRGRQQLRGGRRIGRRLRGRGRARMARSTRRRGQWGRQPASRSKVEELTFRVVVAIAIYLLLLRLY